MSLIQSESTMNKLFVCAFILAAICNAALSACICKDATQPCGNQTDFSVYYVCQGRNTVTLSCPAGSGFLMDDTTTGCTPYSDPKWSCLNPLKKLATTAPRNCKSEYPIAASANTFWVCVNNVATLTPCLAETPIFYAGENTLGCYSFTNFLAASGCSLKSAFYF